MKRNWLLLAAWLAMLPTLAWGQANVQTTPVPWGQTGNTVSLSVSSTSSNVQLGWAAVVPLPQPFPPAERVCNTGTVNGYALLGNSSVVVTSSTGTLISAGECVLMATNGNQYIAGITATSTTTFSIASGAGTPSAGGLGTSGGTGSYMLTGGSNATSAALQALATNAGTAPLVLGGQLSWLAGLGAISQLAGPSDEPLALVATAPVAAATTTVGNALSLSASNAMAGTVTSGAAAGGALTLTAGNAARLTSGNANGGAMTLATGAGIGTGTAGVMTLKINSTAALTLGADGGVSVGTAADEGTNTFNAGTLYQGGVLVRTQLGGNLSLYTNASTGLDTYDCTTATVTGGHGPCKTIGHTIATAYANYDLRNYAMTVNVAAGTYNEQVLQAGAIVGQTEILVVGAGSDMVTVNAPSGGYAFYAKDNSAIQINGMTLGCSAGGSGEVYAAQFGVVDVAQLGSPDVKFAACAGGTQVSTFQMGSINFAGGAATITGAAYSFASAQHGGYINFAGATITVPSALAYTYFLNVGYGGDISNLPTFTGSGVAGTTGTKYNLAECGVIQSNGTDLNTILPGDANGTQSYCTGADYASQAPISTSGPIATSNTTAATSPTTGALISGGGLGVAGEIWGGGNANVAGTVEASGSNAFLQADDRSSSGFGALYRTGAMNYLYDSTYGNILLFHVGVQIGAPTGGDEGAGTLNLAGALYNNGTAPTGTGAYVQATGPTTTGLIATAINTLALRDTTAAFDVTIAATSTSATISAGRALTLDVGNVAHTLAFGTTANTITFPNKASYTVADTGVTTLSSLVTVGALASGSIAAGFGTIATANTITTSNTTAATSGATGAITSGGGVGAAGAMWAGTFFAVSGTTLPSQAAGTLGIGGEVAAPTTSANGEADIYITSTTGGLTLQAKGSTSDITLANSAGTAACTVPTGATGFNCGSFTPTAANAPTVGVALPAAGKLGLYGTTSELFSGATDVWDYGVTTASVFTISGATSLPGIASSGSALDATCWNATGGVLTHNAAGALCSASLEELKDIVGKIAPDNALDEVMRLQPLWAKFKDSVTSTSDHAVHPMFGAHQVEGVDRRLAAYDGDGDLLSVEYLYMPALNTAAIQGLQGEIARLSMRARAQQDEIDSLRARIR